MLKKEVSRMEPDEEVLADAELKPTPQAEAPEPKPAEEQAVPAPIGALTGLAAVAITVMPVEMAAEICELCCLAGLPKLAASFIRASKPLADVRAELQKTRADRDAETEIQSHVLPETSAASGWKATTVKPEDSPFVKGCEAAAERFAQARKKEKAL
jgi:hypothetical protein